VTHRASCVTTLGLGPCVCATVRFARRVRRPPPFKVRLHTHGCTHHDAQSPQTAQLHRSHHTAVRRTGGMEMVQVPRPLGAEGHEHDCGWRTSRGTVAPLPPLRHSSQRRGRVAGCTLLLFIGHAALAVEVSTWSHGAS